MNIDWGVGRCPAGPYFNRWSSSTFFELLALLSYENLNLHKKMLVLQNYIFFLITSQHVKKMKKWSFFSSNWSLFWLQIIIYYNGLILPLYPVLCCFWLQIDQFFFCFFLFIIIFFNIKNGPKYLFSKWLGYITRKRFSIQSFYCIHTQQQV